MGFFSDLFGGKKEVNVTDLLKNISETDGDGIVKIPIQVFAKYLHENGEQRPSQDGGIDRMLDKEIIGKWIKRLKLPPILLEYGWKISN